MNKRDSFTQEQQQDLFRSCLEGAKKQNPEMQLYMAMMYGNGIIVKKDGKNLN